MVPIPTESLKNANPNADNNTEGVILEKSTLNKKLKPSLAPSRVNERIQIIIIRVNKSGIKVFVIFSIPFLTPAKE